jgi:hypothetical protein
MDQVSIKYTYIFHCKTIQNLPKVGFLKTNHLATLDYPYSHLVLHMYICTKKYTRLLKFYPGAFYGAKVGN